MIARRVLLAAARVIAEAPTLSDVLSRLTDVLRDELGLRDDDLRSLREKGVIGGG